MSYIELGALFVESGDVISGTVVDGQFISNTNAGIWAAIVDSGGTLVAASVTDGGGIGVDTGGLAIGTVVSSSGVLDVLGVVSNTLDYGREEIGSGGVAIGETVLGGF